MPLNLQTTEFLFYIELPFMAESSTRELIFQIVLVMISEYYDISIIIIFQRIKRTKKYIGCLLLLLLGENRPFSVKSWPDVLQQLLMHDTHKMRTHFFVQENPTFCFWEGGSRPLIIVKLCLHQLLFYFGSKRSVFKPISFASKNGILSKGTWFFMW